MGKISIHPPTSSKSVVENPLPNVVKTPSGLALLEIQGTLNSSSANDDDGSNAALDIGKISFPLYNPADASDSTSWQKKVHLYVGDNQRLTGELKKLPNPIAVLRKQASSIQEDLEIVDIIYYKIMFTHRPEPYGTTLET